MRHVRTGGSHYVNRIYIYIFSRVLCVLWHRASSVIQASAHSEAHEANTVGSSGDESRCSPHGRSRMRSTARRALRASSSSSSVVHVHFFDIFDVVVVNRHYKLSPTNTHTHSLVVPRHEHTIRAESNRHVSVRCELNGEAKTSLLLPTMLWLESRGWHSKRKRWHEPAVKKS